MTLSRTLNKIYITLLHSYGPQFWWPADSPFEVMVGAILTQNTAWSNVEKAIAGLKGSGVLTPEGLLEIPANRLQSAIRPSGYFRQKAQRLQRLCRFLVHEYGGDLASMESVPLQELRRQLLDLKGIGPETADSILLYALGRPVFVVDAYTVRLFSRLGLCAEKEKYGTVQALFMNNLPHEERLFNEYHALIVKHSKSTCKKRSPLCESCPLAVLCSWRFKIQDPRFKMEKP